MNTTDQVYSREKGYLQNHGRVHQGKKTGTVATVISRDNYNMVEMTNEDYGIQEKP